MELVSGPARRLAGVVDVPGDKSLTHRACLLAAVAEGTSEVLRPNPGADCAATLRAVEALGAGVERLASGWRITGRPAALVTPAGPVDLANSGTGLRLLAGVLAGRRVDATLVGDASLSRRPMGRIVEPLLAMGADVAALGPGQRPPVRVRGRTLHGVRWSSPVASAQVKSCVLLAGLAAEGETSTVEPLASRDHTERMLGAFGVACARPSPLEARVAGPVTPRAARLTVARDFSAAFFWLLAGSIAPAGEVTLPAVGVNPTRTGGLAVLRRMGADVRVEDPRTAGGEPVADLVVRPAALRGAEIGPAEVPALIDELPALAIAQACAQGTSRVRGAAELRVKESDRIALVCSNLRALGVTVHELEDGWEIEGGGLMGGAIDSQGDHRIAMAFLVAGMAAAGPITVRGADMIDTSYPGFYNDLRDRVLAR